MECNCWVARQSDEVRFGIRYGAHDTACPTYRESLDPIDRLNDEELRQRVIEELRDEGYNVR